MFARIWSALSALVTAIETLTATVNEANARSRNQLGLDGTEAACEEEGKPDRKPRKGAA